MPNDTNAAPPEQSVPSSDASQGALSDAARSSKIHATGGALLLLTVLILFAGRIDLLAQSLLERFSGSAAPARAVTLREPAAEASSAFTLSDLTLHPDVMHRPYTAGPVLASRSGSDRSVLIDQFRDLLALYAQSRGRDSNFSIRVLDSRTGEFLELYTLEGEQLAYRAAGKPERYDWARIDRLRREKTGDLVDKYARLGIPREAIIARWGRANQVMEARRRDLPYLAYEVALARHLGLSLLATQIGTVETFNQDKLVSPVGARSRYQMMPYLLRQYDVHHYTLPTAANNRVQVAEEWHPLLVMEPAFLVLRGYVNAVGHELPGLSAYHTGPGNIYGVLQHFLTSGPMHPSSATVADAFIWALTDGFETVSESSSFKSYSRGYVPTAYGMLRAVDELPIDTARTLRADRVQLEVGQSIYLSRLLDALGPRAEALDWGYGTAELSLYNRFRRMNPHMALPKGDSASSGVPLEGDVRLSGRVDGDVPVRFFLPIGATTLLEENGLALIDEEVTFRFDHDTYPEPSRDDRTPWDRQYAALVQDIAHFGFTHENRVRLLALADRFEQLAEAHPTPYRKAQATIIETHRRLWRSEVWEDLAQATAAAMGTDRAPVQPPALLDVPLDLPIRELEQ